MALCVIFLKPLFLSSLKQMAMVMGTTVPKISPKKLMYSVL